MAGKHVPWAQLEGQAQRFLSAHPESTTRSIEIYLKTDYDTAYAVLARLRDAGRVVSTQTKPGQSCVWRLTQKGGTT